MMRQFVGANPGFVTTLSSRRIALYGLDLRSMTTARSPAKQPLPALTSLRFFAALAIFALHASQIKGFPTGDFAGFTMNHGVSFFYVLSGFILHYNYRDTALTFNWPRFVYLRFMRIWPLHVIALAFTLACRWTDMVSWIHAYLPLPSLASIVFLTQSWSLHSSTFFGINGVSWSISTELFFYVCFLGLSVGFRARPLWTLLGMIALHVAYLYGVWSVEPLQQFADSLFVVNPVFRLIEFAIGIVAAEAWARTPQWRISAGWATALELVAVAAVIGGDALTGPVINQLWGFIPPVRMSAYAVWPDPFFAVLLCVFASGRGAISQALAWRPLLVLGEISFAVYLFHQPIQWAVSASGIPGWFAVAVSAAVTLLVSAAAHYWLEKPIYNAARLWRFGDGQPNQRAAAVQKHGGSAILKRGY